MPEHVNKNLLDVAKVYRTYITFAGDAERTAVTLDMDVRDVRDLATRENWAVPVKQWRELSDVDHNSSQIRVNRAINYVQAARARELLDKVVGELSKHSPEELIDALTVTGKHGPEFKTRALTDLVKAIQTCQDMTMKALGDTPDERPDTGSDSKGGNIAVAVLNALNAADEVGLSSVDVVRKQLIEESGPKPLTNGDNK